MIRSIWSAIGMIAATVTVLTLTSGAFAQQSAPRASADPLQEICTGFLEQSGQGVSGDRNSLCSCLVRETKNRLTREEMKIYNEASTNGRQVPDAILQKVVGIATDCLTGAR